MASKNISVEVLLRAATREYVAGMKRAQAATGRFTGELGKENLAKFRAEIGKLQARIASYAAAVASVTLVTKAIIDAGLEFDRINRKLTVATGSSEAARAEYLFLSETAKTLGLNLRSSADGFASFSAAARGTRLEGEGVRDVFIGVTQASTALGLTADQTQGVFTALTQIMSKGKVQAEELTGQLGERLPGALAIAARATGVTTAELYKMLEQGEILADDFLPRFAEQLRTEFAAAAAEAANAPQAAFNRLENAIFSLEAALAGSGIIDGIAGIADKLTAMATIAGYAVDQLNRTTGPLKGILQLFQSIASNPLLGGSLVALGSGLDALAAKVTAAQEAEAKAADGVAQSAKRAANATRERARLEEEISAKVVALAKLEKERAVLASKQILQQRIKDANAALSILRQQLTSGEAAEKQYVEKVKSLRQSLTQTLASDEDRLRDIRRRSMTEVQRQADIEKQAQEKITAARLALSQGDTDRSAALADEAKSISEQVENTRKAVRLYKEAASVYKQSAQSQIADAEKAKTAQEQQNASTAKNIAAVEEQVSSLRDKLAEVTKSKQLVKLDADISSAQSEIDRLQQQINALSQTVTVGIQTTGGFAGGGPATGGHPRRLRTGIIQGPGTAISDSILARVSRGEHAFITRAARAAKLWPLLNQLNFGSDAFVNRVLASVKSGLQLPALAPGGQLTRPFPSAAGRYADGGGVSSGLQSVIINLPLPTGQTESIPLFGERAAIAQLERISKEAQRGRRRG